MIPVHPADEIQVPLSSFLGKPERSTGGFDPLYCGYVSLAEIDAAVVARNVHMSEQPKIGGRKPVGDHDGKRAVLERAVWYRRPGRTTG
jgi:hypothetical protein